MEDKGKQELTETKEERIKRMSRERASRWRANNKERHASYTRQWRSGNRDKARKHSRDNYVKNTPQHRVHSSVFKALASGRLSKPNACERCGLSAPDLHAHHEDYQKRLAVKWLCRDCHAEVHTRKAVAI